jgi:tetratricopeptide (TPR) repeat protein
MFLNGKHYDHAIPCLKKAVELDPGAWVAGEALAICYGGLGMPVEAIAWQRKAIDALPKNLSWVAGYLWPRIALWAIEVDDKDTAILAAERGYYAESACQMVFTSLFSVMVKYQDSDTLVAKLEEMEWRGELRNFLNNEHDIWDQIGSACKKVGKLQFIIDAMDRWLELDNDDILLPVRVGNFKYAFCDDKSSAIPHWENFLERLSEQSEADQRYHEESRRQVTANLARLHFDLATAEWREKPGARSVNADKLKQLSLAVVSGFDDGGFDLYRGNYATMLWGRWLRDYMKEPQAKWRSCFRVRLLEEMNSIDDDDPSNDTQGLVSLAVSLFHAGDRENAAAILAVIFRTVEDSIEKSLMQMPDAIEVDGANLDAKEAENSSTTPTINKATDKAPSPTIIRRLTRTSTNGLRLNIEKDAGDYYCDNCEGESGKVEEMYWCEVCIDVHWCGECLAKFRDPELRPTLQFKACNPCHDVYQVWPIPDDARYLATRSFENGVTIRREWLEKLRMDWWE